MVSIKNSAALLGLVFASLASAGPAIPPKTPGTPCSPEGEWFCAVSYFQRCASGVWSVALQMAVGTQCVPEGESPTITIEYA